MEVTFMRLRIKNDNGIERLYIEKSIRISDKKVTTQNVEKLGRVDVLMASMGLSREQVIAWAKRKLTTLMDHPLRSCSHYPLQNQSPSENAGLFVPDICSFRIFTAP